MGRKRSVPAGNVVELPATATDPAVPAIDSLNHLAPEDDTCAICLEIPKIKGLIGGCSHVFCFACIKSWSDIENTCPICKRPFNQISSQSTPSTETAGINDNKSNKRKRKAKDKSNGEIVHVQNKTQKQNNNNNMFAMRHFFARPFIFGHDNEDDSDEDAMFGGLNFASNHALEMLMLFSMIGGMPHLPGGGRGNRNGGRGGSRAGRGQQRRNLEARNDPITIDDNVTYNINFRRSTPEVIDLISDDDGDNTLPQLVRVDGNSSSSSSCNNQSNNRNTTRTTTITSTSSSSSSSSHNRNNQRQP